MKTFQYLLLLLPFLSIAQVGVNTTMPNAALDIESTENGVLIPRVQLIDALDITTVVNPAGGALATSTLVYNIAASGIAPNNVVGGFYYWDGFRWIPMTNAVDHDWYEAGTTTPPNDITDDIFHTGNVGIGTVAPIQPLHVYKNSNATKSSILGVAIQTNAVADFQNRGIEGYGSGTADSGGYGFGIGVMGIGDRANSYYATGVLSYLGTTTPNAPSTNQALLADGNNLGNAAILTNGNVGIGIPLGTNPTNQLHVNSTTNGAVRIVDGTQGNNKVLTSNATGVATWQNPNPSGFIHYLGELYLGGVIYELYKGSDGLEHGLIVSLLEGGPLAWQTVNSVVGANRSENGAYNSALMTNSPVATFINTLGAGWYLPSVDELNLLYNHRYYVNKTLRAGGYQLLSLTRFYWSSNEYTLNSSYVYNFLLGQLTIGDKSDADHVRGIRAF